MPIACLVLLSGLDDLYLAVVCAREWFRKRNAAGAVPGPALRDIPQKRIAIYVPCWHESAVIGNMIEHNVAAIEYRDYDFFIGAYPNDPPTLDVAHGLEGRFANVHLAVCPHDGPTSKADCLNWIYQRMLQFEQDRGVRFEVMVTHDAEDLIHPESLLTTNRYIGAYDMVQIPVLPLATPLTMLTHGVYCDEFAEFQLKDMPARGFMGSFMPSNGVGTGYARDALEKLADSASNRIFEPVCLTEDYENGMRLHRMGCRQLFVPIEWGKNGIVATREFFPSQLTTAVRQRTRWVTGIALQTWERHGWPGPAGVAYWLWRDRKGLVGSPLSLLTNLLAVYGTVTYCYAQITGTAWGVGLQRVWFPLFIGTMLLQTFHTGVRMAAVAKIYGWVFSLGVPVRTFWANYINCEATIRAVFRYTRAKARREPLVWVKTEHAYPSLAALSEHKRPFGEILVGSGYVDQATLDRALRERPEGMRIGEYLLQLGAISEEELYEALSLQQNVTVKRLEAGSVRPVTARSLPRRVIEQWRVLPYRIESGELYLASPEIPSDAMHCGLREFTRLRLRFQLITPANFKELVNALL